MSKEITAQNLIIGTESNDKLVGGQGDDIMFGIFGNDKFITGSGKDSVIIMQNPSNIDVIYDFDVANDKIDLSFYSKKAISYADLSVTGYSEGVSISLPSGQKVNLVGLSINDVKEEMFSFEKGSGAFEGKLLLGNNSNNILSGTTKTDVFLTGDGADTLVGNGGKDYFVFTSGSGKKTITDFDISDDVLLFKNEEFVLYNNLRVSMDNDDNAVLEYGTTSYTLLGVDREDLTEANFSGVFGNFNDVDWPS